MARDDSKRKEAKRLHLEKGWTQARIAQHLDVATRTVERWAQKDGWAGLKKAQNVVPITEGKKSALVNPTPRHNPVTRREAGGIDEIEVVEGAIASLALLVGGLNSRGEDVPVDARGLGGIASALVRLLEYRRKIQPPSAVELAEQAIALNIPPDQFLAALKEAWRLRA